MSYVYYHYLSLYNFKRDYTHYCITSELCLNKEHFLHCWSTHDVDVLGTLHNDYDYNELNMTIARDVD